MKLTALDIRKQEFSRTLRGYDPDEVDSFIEVISDQWKEMVDELKRDNDRISELELKLEHYHKVEEALEEALQTARTSARQTIVQADIKAKKIIEAAEEDAEKITRDARDHRRDIKREAAKFSVRRKEIVAKLRAFLLSEMEMLAHYDDDDPTGFIKLLGEAAGLNGGQQAQLTAGSPVSDALEEDEVERPKSAAQASAPAPAPAQETQEQYADEADDFQEDDFAEDYADDYTYDESEAYEQPGAYQQHEPQPRSAAPSESEPRQPSQRRADEPREEEPAPAANHGATDDNDTFHNEYERMATIQEVYGQFDPDSAGEADATGDQSHADHDADYPSDEYTERDYSVEDYAGYGDGSHSNYVDDDYADQVNGTADGAGEYPHQSRPAQDRPPADSSAASGRRAPGMNRPDAHQELSESASEDIEKIRRILEDLDN